MLTCFQVVRHFNKLRVAVWVDCEHREAEICVTYDRKLVVTKEKIPFHEVDRPDAAERWLSRPCGERGSFVETLEWLARIGQLGPRPVAA